MPRRPTALPRRPGAPAIPSVSPLRRSSVPYDRRRVPPETVGLRGSRQDSTDISGSITSSHGHTEHLPGVSPFVPLTHRTHPGSLSHPETPSVSPLRYSDVPYVVRPTFRGPKPSSHGHRESLPGVFTFAPAFHRAHPVSLRLPATMSVALLSSEVPYDLRRVPPVKVGSSGVPT